MTDFSENGDANTELETVSSKLEKPKPSRKLPLAGLVLTALYVSALCTHWLASPHSVLDLEPNEFGDFLAGVFAPLAFLWLVLGFFQQGFELRNSANALWLQMEELRNSVDQQKDLVSATRSLREVEREIYEEEKAEQRRSSQPNFDVVPLGGDMIDERGLDYRYVFRIKNKGATCSDLVVLNDGQQLMQMPLLPTASSRDFDIVASARSEVSHRVVVKFFDGRHIADQEIWEIVTGGDRQNPIRIS